MEVKFMKFRVLFLKKTHIYLVILILLLIILFILFITSKASPTSNTISNNKNIKADFNGDGKEDILSVTRVDDNYLMEVTINNKTFSFKTDENSPIIETYSPYWPIRVTLMDISRNKVPEIFIQGSKNNKPLQRVFVFHNNNFDNILSNSNDILGFIDCKNNKTPKVISGKIQGNNIAFSNYIFLNYKFTNYSYDTNKTFIGKDTIYAFIKLIEGLPESEYYKPNSIFSSDISKEDMSLIGRLSGEDNSYVFQDALFKENKCDNKGDISEICWTLNFRGISNADNSIVKNYTLDLILTPDKNSKDNYYFKIASICKQR
ncbi:hypothetical protein CKR_2952 [Clostridium kluyveri NBRC 12016]|nr:hypothetical protein CKR_2952 [Clostridium kluyveri NBRC 12016]